MLEITGLDSLHIHVLLIYHCESGVTKHPAFLIYLIINRYVEGVGQWEHNREFRT